MAVALRHGVSGVGGSNPLVPTKIPLRTSLLWLFFYDCFLNGEAMGNYGGKTRQMLPSDRQHTMIKYLFHFRNSSIRKIIIPIYLTSSF